MYTRGARTVTEITNKHTAIHNDAKKLSGMIDASASNSNIPVNQSYTRLLLNAPEIHSRYTGPFNGSWIGEIVMFRIDQTFSFTFDETLNSVSILPIMNVEILKIED